MLFDEIDRYGKFAWISLIVVGFWVAWPIGLVMLAFYIGRKKMGYGALASGRWCNSMGRRERRGFGGGWGGPIGREWARATGAGSGNASFDAYREETLRRLEDEEREFQEFLERLRKARDKSEFDSFMAERRNRNVPTHDAGESV